MHICGKKCIFENERKLNPKNITMKTTHKVFTTFDDSVSYMSGSRAEIEQSLRYECRQSGRSMDDFIIVKLPKK